MVKSCNISRPNWKMSEQGSLHNHSTTTLMSITQKVNTSNNERISSVGLPGSGRKAWEFFHDCPNEDPPPPSSAFSTASSKRSITWEAWNSIPDTTDWGTGWNWNTCSVLITWLSYLVQRFSFCILVCFWSAQVKLYMYDWRPMFCIFSRRIQRKYFCIVRFL